MMKKKNPKVRLKLKKGKFRHLILLSVVSKSKANYTLAFPAHRFRFSKGLAEFGFPKVVPCLASLVVSRSLLFWQYLPTPLSLFP